MLDSEGLLLLLCFNIVICDVFYIGVGRDTGVGIDDDDESLVSASVSLCSRGVECAGFRRLVVAIVI